MKQLFSVLTALFYSVCAFAQQGTIQYKITLGNSEKAITSTSTMYFLNGSTRVEANIPMPGSGKPIKQTVLMPASKPNVMYNLDDANKSYTETTVSPSATKDVKATVKVLGTETIQGLSCKHLSVTMDKTNMEVWTTKDIPGYEKMMSYWRSNPAMSSNSFYNELKKNNAEGFFVKTKTNGMRGGSMVMEMVSYNTKPVAASLFSIPAGYKKEAGFDPAAMEKMSPAERQKMVEQMMQKYAPKQ